LGETGFPLPGCDGRSAWLAKMGSRADVCRFQADWRWTYGLLFNHIWSFAGEERRNCVSSTFLQPFIAYATKTNTPFTLNTESTYDWHNDQLTVPINFFVSQLTKIGKQRVQFAIGVKVYVERPLAHPSGGSALL